LQTYGSEVNFLLLFEQRDRRRQLLAQELGAQVDSSRRIRLLYTHSISQAQPRPYREGAASITKYRVVYDKVWSGKSQVIASIRHLKSPSEIPAPQCLAKQRGLGKCSLYLLSSKKRFSDGSMSILQITI
jgi:hypothetical protein